MEKNYAGFKDKQALMTKVGYNKMLKEYINLAKKPHANEHCLLIITQYLAKFKNHHVSVGVKFDATKIYSAYIASREIIPLSAERIVELRKSKGFEGIYCVLMIRKPGLNRSINDGLSRELFPGSITTEDYAEIMNSCLNLPKTWSNLLL
jgi:hypothetical protein